MSDIRLDATPAPWAKLVDHWRRQGLPIRPGVSEESIHAFESKYAVRLSADLRAYFQAVDGMEDGFDSEFLWFWPLSRVRLVREEVPRTNYPDTYVFADWSIWAWAYAVRLTDRDVAKSGPIFAVTGGAGCGTQVAPTFREFMSMYLLDPSSVVRAVGAR